MKSRQFFTRTIQYLISVICLSTLFGCNIPEQNTDAIQQAFGGEAGCTIASLASPNGGAIIPGSTNEITSPDDKYNTDNCPYQYVAEVNNPSECNLIGVKWGQSLPSNSAECGSARIQQHWYGYNGSWSGVIYSDYQLGVWNGTCSWGAHASGQPSGSTNVSSYSKIRIAIQAWEWVNSHTDHKFVDVDCVILK